MNDFMNKSTYLTNIVHKRYSKDRPTDKHYHRIAEVIVNEKINE
jgi:hypothetical protein